MTSYDTKPKTKPTLKKYIIPVIILLLVLGAVFWFFNKPKPQDKANSQVNTSGESGSTTAPRPALTVTVTSPSLQNWEQTLTANGNIAAWQEVVIGSELSGLRLTRVNVNVGDVVRRGQVLAEINPQTIAAELAQSRASAAEATAVLNDAAANAKRIQALRNTGAISAQEAAQYSTSQQTAQARLDAAKAQIESIQLRQQQATVISPDDGVISARTATVGSLAQTGQELFRLIRDNRLEWRAEVTASEIYKLKNGLRVSVYPADASLPPIQGTVRMIAPIIDPQTRYGLVYVDLPTNNTLRMGMFSKGIFHLNNKQALTLPQSSILLRDGFAYVFIVDTQNPALARVRQQKVTLGRRLGNQVEVLDLPANVKVAETGIGFLADGDVVKVAKAVPTSPLNRQFAASQGNAA